MKLADRFANIPVTIYGAQGCGKTKHASALAEAFGKTNIADIEDMSGDEPLRHFVLYLTTHIEDRPGITFNLDYALQLIQEPPI